MKPRTNLAKLKQGLPCLSCGKVSWKIRKKKNGEYKQTYCTECNKRACHVWNQQADREVERKRSKVWRENNKESDKKSRERYRDRIKTEAINKLGGKCSCCGVTKGLQIDHIIPSDKKSTYDTRIAFVEITKKDSKEYQLLCWRCNQWKGTGPVCPCSKLSWLSTTSVY